MITRKFARDEGGNIAIMFAFFLTVLLAITGMAVDYAVAIHRKKSMDSAVDAALLAGVNAAGDARKDGKANWKEVGTAAANAMYAANLPPQTNYQSISFKPEFALAGSKLTATANYSGKSFTSFMKMFHHTELTFAGRSQAALGVPSFVDVHFVVDNSSSMGIGATQADQEKMVTGTGCAFGCHQGFGVKDQRYLPSKMNDLGATLRIDLIRQAIVNVVGAIQANSPEHGNVRVAIHTLSEFLTTLAPLSADLAAVKTTAGTLTLTKGDNGGSYLSKGLEDVAALVGTGGAGSGPNDRLSYVVFLSDGVDDTLTARYDKKNYATLIQTKLAGWRATTPSTQPALSKNDKSWMQAFSPSACQTMKSRGHKVLAVQIKYIAAVGFDANPLDALKVNYIRDTLAAPLVTAFQSCGVDGYREAADSASIGPALQAIVNDIVVAQIARLSH